MIFDLAKVRELQLYALTHPLAQAGGAMDRRHFLDAHDGRTGAGIRVALSLNK